jgi:hypothetical protein
LVNSYSLHRIVVTPALAFGKRNELRKDFVTQSTELFEFENGQRVGELRESIDRFLETLIRVQIPGVVKIGEADRQGARMPVHHLLEEILNEYIAPQASRVGSPCFRALIRFERR